MQTGERVMKKIILMCFITFLFSKEYSVTISKADDLYSINYDSFYVELFAAFKFSYGESVILRTNGYGGEICWEEENYNYYSNKNEIEYDCYTIQQVFTEESCRGCYSKNGYNNF